jgi:signal transduction histidine kinase
VLGLSTFLATALVSLTVPNFFFDTPLEELHAHETALHVQQLEPLIDTSGPLHRAVDRLRASTGIDIEIHAGDEPLAAAGRTPPAEARSMVLRPAAHGQPEVVARYALPPLPLPPIDLRHLSATLALVILGGLVHALVLRKLVARPLSRLARAAETFDAGNLEARVGLGGRDEFSEVGRAFDDMAGRIAGFVAAQRELLANVSHELRTPLARIRVVLDTLEATGTMSLVAELHEEVDGLQRLVETLLEAVSLDADDERAGRGGVAQIDAVELLELAARRHERTHPQRRLERSWPAVLPALEGNREALGRALDNVLDNAAKYSEPGQPIRLEASAGSNHLEIAVIDCGMGIAAADLPHVLEPFFRAERSRTRDAGGAGLGLSIVARVIQRHRGRIEIQSAPRSSGESPISTHGTTVRLRLPLSRRGD